VNADWFYSVGDTRQGPVTEDDLQRLTADGKLKPSDLVWRDGMPDWVEARTVAVLFPPKVEPLAEDRPTRRSAQDLDDDRPSVRDRRRRFEDDDDRPRRRTRRDEFDNDDDRPRPRRDDYFDRDDYDERPRSRRSQRPGQVQAVGIMMLVGGIMGILVFLGFASTCLGLLWPGIWYELVISILAIIRGANILGKDDLGPPKSLAIMLIICIVNADIINCVLGIVCLVMLSDQQVQAYYRKKGFY
jgi:hypothetical protein